MARKTILKLALLGILSAAYIVAAQTGVGVAVQQAANNNCQGGGGSCSCSGSCSANGGGCSCS
jgi:hypothetical protein